MGDLIEQARVVGIVPGQGAHAGALDFLQLGIEVDLLARREEIFERAFVQTCLRQFKRAGMPRGFEIAKVIEQAADFDGTDLRNEIEADPIANVSHDDVSPLRETRFLLAPLRFPIRFAQGL